MALAEPCRFAFETTLPQYGSVLGPQCTLVLTVNSGYE
jgi:hypothetical protein